MRRSLKYPDIVQPELGGQVCGDSAHRLLVKGTADSKIYKQIKGLVEGRGRLYAFLLAGFKRGIVRVDFALADFSTYPFTGETILAVFFGHIEDEAGLKAFTDRTDHFVYLLNEHTDYSRCSWEKSDRVEELIKASGLSFSVRHTHLFFNQMVRDEAEKERFIQLNYTQRGRVFSHETVQHGDSIEIIIDKAFSIFDIRRYK